MFYCDCLLSTSSLGCNCQLHNTRAPYKATLMLPKITQQGGGVGFWTPKGKVQFNNTRAGSAPCSLKCSGRYCCNFSAFFEKLFSHLFGGTLPRKTHPYQSTLCVPAAFLSWLMVCDRVLKSTLCKSHEFVSILYLLDDVIPLVYCQNQIFRTEDFELYLPVMAQMAIL